MCKDVILLLGWQFFIENFQNDAYYISTLPKLNALLFFIIENFKIIIKKLYNNELKII